jgi:hypothetical protein
MTTRLGIISCWALLAAFGGGHVCRAPSQNIAALRGSFVARARIAQVDAGLSNELVLKDDEGRFILQTGRTL